MGAPTSVGQPLNAAFLIAIQDLVAGLTGDPELPAQIRHLLAGRSEEHTSELQSHRDLHSFPTRRSSDLRSAPECRIPDSDPRSCSRSYGRSRTPCTDPPFARRLAGEQPTVAFHPSPNTPSRASTPPQKKEEV